MIAEVLLLTPPFLILFLVLHLRIKKRKEKFFPKVSIIVWAWQSGNVIERRIKNLLSLDYPNEYEIIVVDNASNDETEKICKRYARKGLIKYMRMKKMYRKGVGIDKAIRKLAKYEIIAILDPDGICEKKWLRKIVQPFTNPKVGAVVGLIHTGNYYENLFTKLRGVEDEWVYVISPLARNFGKKFHMICGASYAVRKGALKNVSYHGKKTLGEDFELTLKLYAKGWEIELSDAQIWQEEVCCWKEYVKQRVRWIDNTLGGYYVHWKGVFRIIKDRPFGFLLFNFFDGVQLLTFFYMLLLFSRFGVLAGIGLLLFNLSFMIGLMKVKKRMLIKYVPLFLLTEPFLILFCTLKRFWITMRGRKVKWEILGGKYYHRGVRLRKI